MKKPHGPRTKSFCITVPAELKEVIARRALESGRSVSGYLSWLILQDTQKKKVEKR